MADPGAAPTTAQALTELRAFVRAKEPGGCHILSTYCRCALCLLDELDAALRAEPVSPQEWQPIETAPKDGTPFLVLADDNEQFVACWKHGRCELFGAYATISPVYAWMSLPAPPGEAARPVEVPREERHK